MTSQKSSKSQAGQAFAAMLMALIALFAILLIMSIPNAESSARHANTLSLDSNSLGVSQQLPKYQAPPDPIHDIVQIHLPGQSQAIPVNLQQMVEDFEQHWPLKLQSMPPGVGGSLARELTYRSFKRARRFATLRAVLEDAYISGQLLRRVSQHLGGPAGARLFQISAPFRDIGALLSWTRWETRDIASALSLAEELVQEHPSNPEVLLVYVIVFSQTRKKESIEGTQKVRNTLARILKISPGFEMLGISNRDLRSWKQELDRRLQGVPSPNVQKMANEEVNTAVDKAAASIKPFGSKRLLKIIQAIQRKGSTLSRSLTPKTTIP